MFGSLLKNVAGVAKQNAQTGFKIMGDQAKQYTQQRVKGFQQNLQGFQQNLQQQAQRIGQPYQQLYDQRYQQPQPSAPQLEQLHTSDTLYSPSTINSSVLQQAPSQPTLTKDVLQVQPSRDTLTSQVVNMVPSQQVQQPSYSPPTYEQSVYEPGSSVTETPTLFAPNMGAYANNSYKNEDESSSVKFYIFMMLLIIALCVILYGYFAESIISFSVGLLSLFIIFALKYYRIL